MRLSGPGVEIAEKLARLQRDQRPPQHAQWEVPDQLWWGFVICVTALVVGSVLLGMLLEQAR